MLINNSLIIRTGIISSRFVSSKKASPWLLHSFKLPRSIRDNAPQIGKFAGKLMNTSLEIDGQYKCRYCNMTTTNSWNLTQHENACNNAPSSSDQESTENTESPSREDLSIHPKSSKRASMKTSTEVADATDAIDWSKVSIDHFY